MTRIVTTHYRYKRSPRKRKAVALEVPVIVTRASKRIHPSDDTAGDPARTSAIVTSPHAEEKSAIVTIRRKGRAVVPDMTPEEHQRRGDAADAIFQDMKRRIAPREEGQ